MRVHTATTPLPTTTVLGRNPTPSTSTTTLCPKKNMGTKMREMVDRLVTLQHMGKTRCSPVGATHRDGNPTNRQHDGQLFLLPSPPNPTISPPYQTVERTAAMVSSFRPLHFSTPNRCVSRLHPHIFLLRKKIPASHRARGGTPTVSLALGANREGKERVKGKSVCVCLCLLSCTWLLSCPFSSVCFPCLSPISGLIWFGSVYLVTTAGFERIS